VGINTVGSRVRAAMKLNGNAGCGPTDPGSSLTRSKRVKSYSCGFDPSSERGLRGVGIIGLNLWHTSHRGNNGQFPLLTSTIG